MKRVVWLSVVFMLLGLITGFACKSSTTPPVKNPPTINSFAANPTTISSGGSSTLSWDVSDATSVSINQGIGSVSTKTGTTSVSPTDTTTYTLTATNDDGTKTANCTVTVEQNLPTIEYFLATPASIKLTGSSTLTWSVQNAATIAIDQGVGTVSASGTKSVSPADTTTYTLTATNNDGAKTASCTVTVEQVLPTIVYFLAKPTSIKLNDPSTLNWSVQDASTITIDHGGGQVPAAGSWQVFPLETTMYTLTAINPVGQSTATCQVEILKQAILNMEIDLDSLSFIYYMDTTNFSFNGVITESNGLGGQIDIVATATYLGETYLGAWYFDGGRFDPYGTFIRSCEFSSPGQPDYLLLYSAGVDDNGYSFELGYEYSISWMSPKSAVVRFLRTIDPKSNDRIQRSFKEHQRNKR